MADMFGAPIGIGAAETDIRQNIQGALLAQKTLGEIEKQPAEKALAEAHAKLYGAEAELKAQQALEHKTLADLAMEMQRTKQDAATGKIRTVEDAQKAETGSLAEPLEALYNFGVKKGVNPVLLSKAATQAATIRQKEAAAVSSNAAALDRRWSAGIKQAELISSAANAALENPERYPAILMQAAQMGLPVQMMPTEFDQERLIAARDFGIKTKDKIEAARKAAHDKAQEKRWAASSAKDASVVKVNEQRVKVLGERYNKMVKDGASGGVDEAKRELTASRRALREARERKEFPPAPLDPKARREGQTYTAADGVTRFLWTKDPATGKQVAMVVGSSRIPAGAARADEAEDEDNLDEEGNE